MAWPLIAMGVSAAISSISQWNSGRGESRALLRAGQRAKEASEYAARLEEFNAKVAAEQADDAVARGEIEAERYRTQVKGVVGSQRAGFAATNVDVSFGSPLDVIADTAYQGTIDEMTIRQNAQREAWGYRVSAADYQRRAVIRRREGTQALQAAREGGQQVRNGVFTSILGNVIPVGVALANQYGSRLGGSRGYANRGSAFSVG